MRDSRSALRAPVIAFAALFAAAASGCGNPIRPVAPDTTPPAIPTLMVVTSATTSSSVRLAWAAVGDDGNSGTATQYELRYRLGTDFPQPLFDQGEGTVASGMPAPHTAGTPESLTVAGLVPDADYAFLMRVVDDAGNARFSNFKREHTRP